MISTATAQRAREMLSGVSNTGGGLPNASTQSDSGGNPAPFGENRNGKVNVAEVAGGEEGNTKANTDGNHEARTDFSLDTRNISIGGNPERCIELPLRSGPKSPTAVNDNASASRSISGRSGENGLMLKESHLDDALMELFRNNKGVLAEGGSSSVLDGVWDERRVAVKLWNQHHEEGRETLRNEIVIYRFLQQECPFVLGSAVPMLILAWDNPECDSIYGGEVILVTEQVGRDLVRGVDGRLRFRCDGGFKLVDPAEEHAIRDSALKSLDELHSNGIIHGDVALRNMRVERQENDVNSSVCWSVWWVDLGHAMKIKNKMERNLISLDNNDCFSLFQ